MSSGRRDDAARCEDPGCGDVARPLPRPQPEDVVGVVARVEDARDPAVEEPVQRADARTLVGGVRAAATGKVDVRVPQAGDEVLTRTVDRS